MRARRWKKPPSGSALRAGRSGSRIRSASGRTSPARALRPDVPKNENRSAFSNQAGEPAKTERGAAMTKMRPQFTVTGRVDEVAAGGGILPIFDLQFSLYRVCTPYREVEVGPVGA